MHLQEKTYSRLQLHETRFTHWISCFRTGWVRTGVGPRKAAQGPPWKMWGPQTIMGFIKQLSLTGEARIVGVCLTMWHTVE